MSLAGAREWLSPARGLRQGEGHGWLYHGGRDHTHSISESALGMWSIGAKPEENRLQAESLLRRARGWRSLALSSLPDVTSLCSMRIHLTADGEAQVKRTWVFNDTVEPRNRLTADAPCDRASAAIPRRAEFSCECHHMQYFFCNIFC